MNLTERFLNYVKVHTTSDPKSGTHPSTKRQFDLAKMLKSECEAMGLEEVILDEHCNVMATLPANTDKKLPVLGLLAHMDTSPAMSGENVNPRIVKNYDGKAIQLNEALDIYLSPEEFPELSTMKGLDLIVTDGTTLLGADDKAGVAAIMDTMETLLSNPEIKHGKIRIAFTPDEEIGDGTATFDVEKFGADFALTIDGGPVGEVQYECFNGADAEITIYGKSVHPGTAKGKMINAMTLAAKLDRKLPEFERPEYTEGYEGFYHLDEISGNVEKVQMTYIIRDHDMDKFEERKKVMEAAVSELNKETEGRVEIDMKDSYYNMAEKVKPHMEIVDRAVKVMKDMGIEPNLEPIRGGTDGAALSWKGLPTPNIFTGGYNYHGKFEYIPVQHLELCRDFILNYIQEMEREV